MNCRPGDLARVVGLHPLFGLNDKIVQLANLPPVVWSAGAAPQWRFEKPIFFLTSRNVVDASGTRYFAGEKVGIDAMADANLRPIRPQPDEAVDEMVHLVGAAPRTLTEVREVVS